MLTVALLAGLALYWVLTRPYPLSAEALAQAGASDSEATAKKDRGSGARAETAPPADTRPPDDQTAAGADESADPDAPDGRDVFNVAGCASCHTAPGAEAADAPVLAGGKRFATPFGTFVAPNISPDPEAGVGDWSDAELMNAVLRGISPEGSHYYPAFPYATYTHARPDDVRALIGYLRGLPADATPSQPHEISFPFNIRRNLGLWKRLFVSQDWVMTDPPTPEATRGRYLVEALGHCGECHTPRNILGGPDRGAWLRGGPNPSGKGTIPDITPAGLDWSQADIAGYLKTGFTPDYDTAGGEMVDVIQNLSKLPQADLDAIAAYLKAVPIGN